MKMRREDFQNKLAAASFTALRFGQNYLEKNLSINLYYVLILNECCDGGNRAIKTVRKENNPAA